MAVYDNLLEMNVQPYQLEGLYSCIIQNSIGTSGIKTISVEGIYDLLQILLTMRIDAVIILI